MRPWPDRPTRELHPPRTPGLRTLSALFMVILSGCISLQPLRAGRPDVDVRRIREAGRRSDPTLTTPLVEILRRWTAGEGAVGSQLYYQVLAASLALGDRGDQEGVPSLVSLVDDPDPSIRAHAAEALVLLGGVDGRRALERLRAVESDPRVRLRAQ